MIEVTFTTPLLESEDCVYTEGGGPIFFKSWLKAYNPKKGIILLDDGWDFRFEEHLNCNTFLFSKKNDLDITVIAGRIKRVTKYEQVETANYVGAVGIAASPL